MTKLIGITRVKNEADFIEYFARYNFKILDELYIADDRSSDDTTKIINLLRGEGLKIELIPIKDRNARLLNLQGEVMTQLMRHAASKQNTKDCYIFALDADEIILGKREEIINLLRALTANEYALIKWKTFAPIKGGLSSIEQLHNIFTPLIKEQKIFKKVIIPIQHSDKATIAMGNHDISFEETNLKSKTLNMELGHFPVRSADQIVSSALVRTHKLYLKNRAGSGEGYHTLALTDYLRKLDYKPNNNELTHIALNYLAHGEYGELDENFDMRTAFPPIAISYTKNTINPVRALDELLQDIIINK